MKRLIVAVVVMLLSGCAAAQRAEKVDLTYQRSIDLPGQSKSAIREKSIQWIFLRLKSAQAAAKYESNIDGSIVGYGAMARIPLLMNGFRTGTISYSMREDIEESKADLTFNAIAAYDRPWREEIVGVEYPILKSDIKGMRVKFDALTDDLQKYILGGKVANDK